MNYFTLTEGRILRDLGVISLIPTRGPTIIQLRVTPTAYLPTGSTHVGPNEITDRRT